MVRYYESTLRVAVEDMTSVSSRASDLNSSESEEDDIGCQSDVSSEGRSDVKSSKQSRLATASSNVESSEEDTVTSVQTSSSRGGTGPKKVDTGEDIKQVKKQSKGKSPKKATKIKVHITPNLKQKWVKSRKLEENDAADFFQF